jgi:hypothetical protein
VENFKTWKLTYTAELVSTSDLNVSLLHEAIAKALRDEAGTIGYLVGSDTTDLLGEKPE